MSLRRKVKTEAKTNLKEDFMDQQKIGQFIGQLRKEKGMTQKELANVLGITDKTVSKWETGKGMPDVSSFEPICKVFEINMNELISGSRISPEDYSERMEENMMELIKDNQKNKASKVAGIIGGILLVAGLIMIPLCTGGVTLLERMGNYLDIPSLLLLAVISFGGALLSGAKTKRDILHKIRKIVIPVGCIISVFSVSVIVGYYGDLITNENLGPNLAIAFLAVLYALIAYVVLVLLEKK